MSRLDDPYGKRALFSPPPGATIESHPVGEETTGRRALFSEPTASESVVVGAGARGATIECSACREVSEVGIAGLVRSLVPSLLVPGLRWPLYMRCPVCARLTWCSLDWKPLLPF